MHVLNVSFRFINSLTSRLVQLCGNLRGDLRVNLRVNLCNLLLPSAYYVAAMPILVDIACMAT
jgi:hypothetical protein